jgi:methylase of polypeptide subunit release factors
MKKECNMNYLKQAYDKLQLEGVYFTPKKVVTKIQKEQINALISNPPYKK